MDNRVLLVIMAGLRPGLFPWDCECCIENMGGDGAGAWDFPVDCPAESTRFAGWRVWENLFLGACLVISWNYTKYLVFHRFL